MCACGCGGVQAGVCVCAYVLGGGGGYKWTVIWLDGAPNHCWCEGDREYMGRLPRHLHEYDWNELGMLVDCRSARVVMRRCIFRVVAMQLARLRIGDIGV